MRPHNIAILIAAGLALTGCAKRWEPKGPGLVITDPACPGRKAPAVTDFGDAGVHSIYLFTIDKAPKGSIKALLKQMKRVRPKADLGTLMLNLGGVDTLFVTNDAPLADQAAVDVQFAAVCRIELPGIFLNNVQYNPIGKKDAQRRVQ
jgi:hypothetical protein